MGSDFEYINDFQTSVVQAELEKINGENQRLKEMLNQVTAKYSSLQMHITSLMQNQRFSEGAVLFEGKLEENKENGSGGAEIVPRRQFMDHDHQEKVVVESSTVMREDDSLTDQSSQGWGSNKVPRFDNFTKPTNDQAEATMRKARVSVRARSDASMV